MIADSPYRVDRLILPALAGVGAGAAAALVMLAVLRVAGEEALSRYLAAVGSSVSVPTGAPVWVVHLMVGALGGLLYAANQKTAPVRGLLAVGMFYGFLTWVVGGLLAAALLGEPLRAALRAWAFLAACLGYGLTLAGTAMLWQLWRPAAAGAAPRD